LALTVFQDDVDLNLVVVSVVVQVDEFRDQVS
jgi:hypothetical protein